MFCCGSNNVVDAPRKKTRPAIGAEPEPLFIVHFNDVYEIQDNPKKEVCGGASRFYTLVKSFQHLNPLVLFSGDLWNPSKLGAIFKGEQCIVPINKLNCDVACLGNHDLDLGEERAIDLNRACNFPWLLTNVTFVDGHQIAHTKKYHIVERGSYKVGFIGIAEFDWITTLTSIELDDVHYDDIVTSSDNWGQKLKNEHGCNFVIALTHMRVPNDVKLARESKHVDLFLGGHDHIYTHQKVGENVIVKSGCDFRNLSLLKVQKTSRISPEEVSQIPSEPITDKNVETGKKYTYQFRNNQYKVSILKYDVTKSVPTDPELEKHVDKYYAELKKKMLVVNSKVNCKLDTRFSEVRTRETEIGNFVADICRAEHHADISMVQGGTIRADRIFEEGEKTVGDWYDLFPFTTHIMKIGIRGATLRKALENGVSKYPALEGRWLHVSGIKFTFDPEKEPGSRIIGEIEVDGEPLDPEKKYICAVPDYLCKKKDGFECMSDIEIIVEEENAPTIKKIVIDFFNMALSETFLAEKELVKKHSHILSREHIKKTAKEKMEASQAKLKAVEAFSNMTQRPKRRLRSRSHKSLTVVNIDQFLEQGLAPTAVMSRRIKKYELIDTTDQISDDHGSRFVFGIKPKIEGRIVRVGQDQQEWEV